ncbi:unnamed protein product [Didymodactylos carnosus]|uniref:Putative auto-transporter adhesin head GIN domain-containing protein n=1 Tax=Didymodactylos carnosus TaxID=1234261 RepID=A0A815VCT5_9BILA|nr:unnamed protein product [Didymodactylos carnosus]CAF4386512.1 unnamed protein product [Didymodactylos carnosus]
MFVGNGNVQRKVYNVGSFHSILVNGTIDIRLAHGEKQLVEIETDENLHYTDAVQLSINENDQRLSIQDHNCRYTKMIGYIQFVSTPPGLKSLKLNGTGLVQSTNEIFALDNTFSLTINGTRKVELRLDTKNGLELEMNGTSHLTLSGNIQNFADIKQNGSTQFDGKNCTMSQATLDLRGTSTAYIIAQDEINVNVKGVSRVFYRGPLRKKTVESITSTVQEF